ncbi:MAG: hypothetical protein AAF664_15280 [Planctomycetota bacterium]
MDTSLGPKPCDLSDILRNATQLTLGRVIDIRDPTGVGDQARLLHVARI